jgi:hypothetical protein
MMAPPAVTRRLIWPREGPSRKLATENGLPDLHWNWLATRANSQEKRGWSDCVLCVFGDAEGKHGTRGEEWERKPNEPARPGH